MLFRVHGCLVACALIATLIPRPAAAGPITDLAPMLEGDGFILHGGYRLTIEDIAVLSGRDDNGWHLGWFKKKLRDSGFQGVTFDPNGANPIWLPGVGSGAGASPTGLPPSNAVPGTTAPWDASGVGAGAGLTNNTPAAVPLVTPEPGSLVLLGTGLLALARHVRRRGAGRQPSQK